MLEGKHILIGVSGGIAAYKTASLVSALIKHHAEVRVVMTENATKIIGPSVFDNLTGNRTAIDTFDRNHTFRVEHIALADWADYLLIAPATANVIAKAANGIADDMLTTTLLACRCPKAVAPAMNTNMYENPVTQDNLQKLQSYGFEIVEPGSGFLACGSVGKGRMAEPEELLACIIRHVARPQDLKGKKVLVTAGPTQEAIDPVRFITNRSSGRMGYAIAQAAADRGAEVTLVSGKCALTPPWYVETVTVRSAKEMFDAVTSRSATQDIIIKAAAVADYRPANPVDHKIKKKDGDEDLTLFLERTDDILKYLGEHKPEGQLLCGFAMETENLIENARDKLARKHLDMIAANSLREEGAGFEGDTNILTLITKDDTFPLSIMSKRRAADELLDRLLDLQGKDD